LFLKFHKKILYFLLFVLIYFSIPVNSIWEYGSNLKNKSGSVTADLVAERNFSISTEQFPKYNFLLKSSNTFSTTLSENNTSSNNPLVNQNSKKNNVNLFGIFLKKKNAKYFTTLVYITQFKFIYTILKNSVLIYPFHFFK